MAGLRFSDDYNNLTLEETEDFVGKNGRLPGIHSAEKIINDGLNIGEMQKIQMEKIEEIYLHLFELNQRVNQLEIENGALLKENEKLKK